MQARVGGQTEEIARHRDRPNQLGGVLMDERPELLKPEAARILAKPDSSEPVVLDAGKRPAAKRSRPARARGTIFRHPISLSCPVCTACPALSGRLPGQMLASGLRPWCVPQVSLHRSP